MLNDYGYSVHCVNIAGHGTYPQELLRTSWEDAVDKAWYDYDLMKNHYDKVYIGGLSMGGCLSLALASRREDIDGVISLSTPMWLDPSSFIMDDYAGHNMPMNEGRFALMQKLVPWLNDMDGILA